MTREVFFEIMGKIFYEALKEILSSRCFPLPQKFFSQFYCGEEMECSPDFAHFRSNVCPFRLYYRTLQRFLNYIKLIFSINLLK